MDEKPRLSACIQIDDMSNIVTIYGIRYSGSLFEAMAHGPLGQAFVIVSRSDGVVVLREIPATEHCDKPQGRPRMSGSLGTVSLI